jgi:hypothetical protein
MRRIKGQLYSLFDAFKPILCGAGFHFCGVTGAAATAETYLWRSSLLSLLSLPSLITG